MWSRLHDGYVGDHMRDNMVRRATPSERFTSPTRNPPPPCKQALTACLHGPQTGELRCGGSPHPSCKRDQIKMREYKDRRVTSPKRVTSTSKGHPLNSSKSNHSNHSNLNSSSSMRNNAYLLTLQAKCATIWKGRLEWLALTILICLPSLRKSLAKVLTNQSTSVEEASFQNKTKKQPRCVKVGYGPLNFGGNQGALWEIREWWIRHELYKKITFPMALFFTSTKSINA